MRLINKYKQYRKRNEINTKRINETIREDIEVLLHNKSMVEIVDFMNKQDFKSCLITDSFYFNAPEREEYIHATYVSNYITSDLILEVVNTYDDSKKKEEPRIHTEKTVYMLNQLIKYEIGNDEILLYFGDKTKLYLHWEDETEGKYIKKIVANCPI